MFNPTHANADFSIQEPMQFESLTISEYSASPNPYGMEPAEAKAQIDLSDTCLEEIVVEKLLSPRISANMSDKVDDDENSAVSISSSTHSQEDFSDFPFPPILSRTTAGAVDGYGSLTLIKKPKIKETEYDSDDTCDDYVQCGEKGLCKCQRMRGREYYEYYARTKDSDYYTMYPQGRCTLPRGATFHFTGAPDNLKREDLQVALVALGAKIEFIDYQRGSKEGWVRLSFPYEARIIIKKMVNKKINVAGTELDFRVISGKDEKRYHKKAIEAIYQLQEKAKGLNKKLKKAGYNYVTTFCPDDDSIANTKKKSMRLPNKNKQKQLISDNKVKQ